MLLKTLLTPLLLLATCAFVDARQQTADTTVMQAHNGSPKRKLSMHNFIDRIVPEVTLQYQRGGDYLLLDVTPSVGFQINDKFAFGVGWNRRIAYNERYDAFSNAPRTFGVRTFATYEIAWSLSPRIEFEMMNAPVPPIIQRITADYSDRQWVPGVFVGVQKVFKLAGNVHGNCMILFRTFNPDHKSPYGDVINIRFGLKLRKNKLLTDKISSTIH